MGLPVVWTEKPEHTWQRYTARDQHTSSSCIFHSIAKALETFLGEVVSARPYFWRQNYPHRGASLQNGCDIAKNRHFPTEADEPSMGMEEKDMNVIKALKTSVAGLGYKFPNFKNIDEIAEAVQAYGQCVITFGSNNNEYTRMPIYYGGKAEWFHAICAVDFTLINGKKVLICEDSVGKNTSPDGSRLITEDFWKHRGTGAVYFTGATSVAKLQLTLREVMLQLIELLKKKLSTLTSEKK